MRYVPAIRRLLNYRLELHNAVIKLTNCENKGDVQKPKTVEGAMFFLMPLIRIREARVYLSREYRFLGITK